MAMPIILPLLNSMRGKMWLGYLRAMAKGISGGQIEPTYKDSEKMVFQDWGG
jgi:hypothetical protein